jgi:hypothetical protein
MAAVAKGAAVVAAGAALAFANTTPASAHGGHWIYVTGGQATWNGSFVQVCDTAMDGNRVRVQLRQFEGATVYFTGWAPSQGRHSEGHPSWISQYRVCAENIGCSSWHARY